MSPRLLSAAAAAALVALASSNANARSHHVRIAAHHHRLHARALPFTGPATLGYRSPVDPRYGYEESPYDPSYQGPGAEVFALTKKAQHEPGVTLELAPDAKETATGGPAGGVPGHDGT